MGVEVFMDGTMNGRMLGGEGLEAYHKERKRGVDHDRAMQTGEDIEAERLRQRDEDRLARIMAEGKRS